MCGTGGSGGGAGGGGGGPTRPQARPSQPSAASRGDGGGGGRSEQQSRAPQSPATQLISMPSQTSRMAPQTGPQQFISSVAGGTQGDGMRPAAPATVRTFDVMGFGDSRRRDITAGAPSMEVSGEVMPEAIETRQPYAPLVGGGEPGVGAQGFGSRALIGGEGEIVQSTDPQSFADPLNTMPAINAPSDLAMDPNYVEPSPGQAPMTDTRYSVPFINVGPGGALIPNSRGAATRATGPISRGLMSARSGFGRAFM